MNAAFIIFFSCFSVAFAQNATTPGGATSFYNTVTNLSIDWPITGDANLNCAVTVAYRIAGESAWRNAMPLRRVPAGAYHGYANVNKLSGSIFDLKPGTSYEIHLTLFDPDGGSAERTITAKTKAVPRITANCDIINLPPTSGGILTVTSGTASRPRVYLSSDHKAVYSGVNMSNAQWVYVEGIVSNGTIFMSGAQNCVVRRCSIFVSEDSPGILGWLPGMYNCYISDNVITGSIPWQADKMGVYAGIGTQGICHQGIRYIGSVNVICHNRITGFRSLVAQLNEEEEHNTALADKLQYSGNDIYNNDLYNGLYEGIKVDYAMGNCRVLRNRLTNTFNCFSSMPSIGGPTYFIRNVMYNATCVAYKFNLASTGNTVMHNTVVKPGDGLSVSDAGGFKTYTGMTFDFAYFRNNLSIGGPPGNQQWGGIGCGAGYAAKIGACSTHCSFDYDAVGVAPGGIPYDTYFPGGIKIYEAEPNCVERVGMSVFDSVPFPADPGIIQPPQDLRPVTGSVVQDKGLLIPNVNDNFLGSGPDIGAYESGQALPLYGPRPEGIDEDSSYKSSIRPPHVQNTFSSRKIRFGNSGQGAFLFSPLKGNTVLYIYDTKGKRVKTLCSGYTGKHGHISWDGRTDAGTLLSNGVYFIELRADDNSFPGKFLLLR